MLIEAGCEVRGDPETQRADSRVKPATEEDWPKEYLDAIIAVKVVDGLDEAIEHIARYGSQHTDAIVTEDQRGRRAVSSPASTAPSCCTTPRRNSPMAASSAWAPRSASPPGASMRVGPVGVEQLTTFKYVVRGQARSGLSCSLETVSVLLDTGLGRYDREEIDCRKRG